jgi:DNA-binding FadR family transcriptional regulator
MRIAGIRLEPHVARLLSEILEGAGFHDTASRVVVSIERGITTEAPLTIADHEAILEALGRDCPPTLRRLLQELLEEQRRIRRITGAG